MVAVLSMILKCLVSGRLRIKTGEGQGYTWLKRLFSSSTRREKEKMMLHDEAGVYVKGCAAAQ